MRYIDHYQYTTDKNGRVLWARDTVTGRFVNRATVQSLLDAQDKTFDNVIAVMLLLAVAAYGLAPSMAVMELVNTFTSSLLIIGAGITTMITITIYSYYNEVKR